MATTDVIQSILAPVVMITACALLLNSIGAQYTNFANQLRALALERVELLRQLAKASTDLTFLESKLEIIDRQLPLLLSHHHSLHNTMLLIYLSIIACLTSMSILGCSVVFRTVWVERAALLSFLIGVVTLFIGMLVLTRCFRGSHQLEQFIVHKTCQLAHPTNPSRPEPAPRPQIDQHREPDSNSYH